MPRRHPISSAAQKRKGITGKALLSQINPSPCKQNATPVCGLPLLRFGLRAFFVTAILWRIGGRNTSGIQYAICTKLLSHATTVAAT